MIYNLVSKLDRRKKYLQLALNNTLEEAYKIINNLPLSDRIIVEVGTPIIKRYGEEGIRQIRQWYEYHIKMLEPNNDFSSYIVADLKTMDRGKTEVEIAARAGASAAIALGTAPIETLNSFIEQCEICGIDPIIDMMNVEFPLSVLRSLKKIPPIVIIHRGVDEEQFNKEKQIPLHEIRRIKANYNIMIAIAGGDTFREVQRSIFNDADIVIIWKSIYQQTKDTTSLIKEFLKEIK
ncbi:MAG: orotidine 5'-phosphate decarboxylase [Patescibacteria group bacterium]|nr:orotidine 5'-phosphate decarboxylase [Patescibacteria group bacterium]MCX7589582.1 orotidine 5'-phosphate decarboxylase [Patescibacteria group bacterium]MDW8279859.1 orotidine 5'-phosphate decarboxylase / HUMPS family protein [bacterium]